MCDQVKYCSGCDLTLPRESFPIYVINKKLKNGTVKKRSKINSICTDCKRRKDRERYNELMQTKEGKQRLKSAVRKYRKTSKGKAARARKPNTAQDAQMRAEGKSTKVDFFTCKVCAMLDCIKTKTHDKRKENGNGDLCKRC